MAKKQKKNHLAFELGFDWGAPPIQGVRDGVYPLQLALVDDRKRVVVSQYDSSVLKKGGSLRFRVYDFTDPAVYPDSSRPRPNVLQILFTSAAESDPSFSPILGKDDEQQAQLVALYLDTSTDPSIAYVIGANPVPGWKALWHLDPTGLPEEALALGEHGRFNFRALLTAAIPGTMARFYRADPEMVVGHGGP